MLQDHGNAPISQNSRLNQLSNSLKKRPYGLLLLLLISIPIICYGCSSNTVSSASGLVISEVMSSNDYTLTDEAYGTPDWIELHNTSSEEINLEGYCLSNNTKKLRKWGFCSCHTLLINPLIFALPAMLQV